MASRFELLFSRYFKEQWVKFNKKEQDLIAKKLKILKENPFRYEVIEGYRFVFKINVSLSSEYSRLVYAVFVPEKNNITVLGVFDRKADYKDFIRIFKSLKEK